MWRRHLIILTFFAQGCTAQENPSTYPTKWPPLTDSAEVCQRLDGKYSLYSDDVKGFEDVSRTLMLPTGERINKRLDSISLETIAGNVLHVTGNHMGEGQIEATYSEKDKTLSCDSDGARINNKLSHEKFIHDSEFANFEVNSTHLLKASDGSLIVKIDYTGAGMALFLPWAYSGTRWQRLKLFVPTDVRPRKLTPTQEKSLSALASSWATIPGTTSRQMASVFVESAVRTKANTFEIEDLADQIAEILSDAGWNVDRNQVAYHFAFEGVGVGILTSSNARGVSVAEALVKELNFDGIMTSAMNQRRPGCEETDSARDAIALNPRCSQISIFVGYHP